MKIKFEIKSNPKSSYSSNLFTIFMENKTDDNVEFLITKFNLRQLSMGDRQVVAEKSDIPINDGLLTMSKINLKKFIAALQLLSKS
jgi:hypothetical protein